MSKKVGRPTKAEAEEKKRLAKNAKISRSLTKLKGDALERLRSAFAIGSTIEEACYYAGVEESTYYKARKKNPDVFKEIEDFRNDPILESRKTVANKLKEKDSKGNYTDSALRAAQWFLERKRAKEFGNKLGIEHSGQVEGGTTATPEMLAIKEKFEKEIYEAAGNVD